MTDTSTEQPEALVQELRECEPSKLIELKAAAEIKRLYARVQELEAEKARLIEAYVPCPSATEAYMYGITQEKQG